MQKLLCEWVFKSLCTAIEINCKSFVNFKFSKIVNIVTFVKKGENLLSLTADVIVLDSCENRLHCSSGNFNLPDIRKV